MVAGSCPSLIIRSTSCWDILTRHLGATLMLMDDLLAHLVLSAAETEKILASGTMVNYAAIERLDSAGILRPKSSALLEIR